MSGQEKRVKLNEALALVKAHRPHKMVVTENVENSLGLTLAEDIIARTTLPPDDVSAMDGYAVKLSDTRLAGSTLTVIGEAPAGKHFSGSVETGEAVQIFTGGVVPRGADHILIQEMVERSGNEIAVKSHQKSARHIRPAGQDFRAGDVILSKGTRLRPADLGVIAAANMAEVQVYKSLQVALLTNGNELRAPGTELSTGEIINSNSYALSALCRSWNAEPAVFEPAKDTMQSVTDIFERSTDADVIVLVGGASVGKYDVVKPALDAIGIERLFSGILMRPGKPSWFGTWQGKPVLGLPGNPVAAYVGANLLLACLLGVFDELPMQSAFAASALEENGNRERFSLAVVNAVDGRSVVEAISRKDTSLTTSLSRANCLLHRPANAKALQVGDPVSVLPLA